MIEELERAGYEYEENTSGWGFDHPNDKALKKVRKLKTIAFLDLFETCDEGGVTDAGLATLKDNHRLQEARENSDQP